MNAMRRGFTLPELMVSSAIGMLVLGALMTLLFLTADYYQTLAADALKPSVLRELRDRMYFRMTTKAGTPLGYGLLSLPSRKLLTVNWNGEDLRRRLGGFKLPAGIALLGTYDDGRSEADAVCDWDAIAGFVRRPKMNANDYARVTPAEYLADAARNYNAINVVSTGRLTERANERSLDRGRLVFATSIYLVPFGDVQDSSAFDGQAGLNGVENTYRPNHGVNNTGSAL